MAADTGMDTCPSPEITDSRKRPLDGDSENGDVKRSHFSSVQDLVTALPLANGHGNITSHFAVEPTYHFKVLVPSMVAGAIIGKGGETIAQLQKDTGARVKMSKSHDFYPGTTERACLITGSVDGIMVVLDFIMDKIKEKPELVKPFPEGVDTKMPQDRDKQVKILVPNSTAGMIIGKGGNYIKQIKEQSGSYVQISQKAKELSLQERCITVVGEKENNKKACLMILQKVVDDPQSGSCPNVSYADVAGPVANYNPTGSPYAVPTAEVKENHGLAGGVGSVGSVLVNGGGVGSVGSVGAVGALSLSLSLAPPGQGAAAPLSQHTLDSIKAALRQAGYSDAGVSEIGAALALLVKHGVLGLALPAALPAPPLSAAYFPLPAQDPPAVFGPIGQVPLGMYSGGARGGSLERFAEVAFEALRPPAVAPISLSAGVGGVGGVAGFPSASLLPLSKSPTPADAGAKDSKNVEIAEVIVGAILGPGGRSLVEIQQMSGANIQISKKGTFAPGTRNRIVTISGSATAISNAQYLIDQKIQEEELKRTRHNAISGLMQ
ncbi:RNA-binding protein Pasilla isoform X1 [Helicoverpa armigera]|uniref:RNA-binding protein Pasilla isoform X1 n=1 Tax=Helicoverpa armigera TaxID=29058 RepID=UPI000B375636|nr:RNA-binding protein Pasilla isoform X1 [Helicoverpa armigera]XP_047033709.1 RNA-binding protein Pasilla isoform X1 [Helicoverpa zea]